MSSKFNILFGVKSHCETWISVVRSLEGYVLLRLRQTTICSSLFLGIASKKHASAGE